MICKNGAAPLRTITNTIHTEKWATKSLAVPILDTSIESSSLSSCQRAAPATSQCTPRHREGMQKGPTHRELEIAARALVSEIGFRARLSALEDSFRATYQEQTIPIWVNNSDPLSAKRESPSHNLLSAAAPVATVEFSPLLELQVLESQTLLASDLYRMVQQDREDLAAKSASQGTEWVYDETRKKVPKGLLNHPAPSIDAEGLLRWVAALNLEQLGQSAQVSSARQEDDRQEDAVKQTFQIGNQLKLHTR